MSDIIYCYPDSDVLKNKLHLTSKTALANAELYYTSVRILSLQKHSVTGKFDFSQLCRIHKYIFQDIYEWAGKPRTVNIGKGNLFCLVQHIPGYADSVFSDFAAKCISSKSDKELFVRTLVNKFADMNALHPFREGNGRTQREFTRELCLKCGYKFDLTHTTHNEMVTASILSFDKGDNSKLEQIFSEAIQPIGKR